MGSLHNDAITGLLAAGCKRVGVGIYWQWGDS